MQSADSTFAGPESLPAAVPGMPMLRWAAFLAITLGAMALGWASWQTNIALSCWKREWPGLPVCADITGNTNAQRLQARLVRLQAEPGETQSLVEAMVYAYNDPQAPEALRRQLLDEAASRSPQNADVLKLQANEGIANRNWPQTLRSLTRLSLFHQDREASMIAARLLMQAADDERLQEALIGTVEKYPDWLDPVARNAPRAGVPLAATLPLVDVVMSLPDHRVSPQLGLFIVDRLKAEGVWTPAYDIWLYLWQRKIPLVFNGTFDQDFIPNAFDWEIGDVHNDHRSGAVIDRVFRPDQGHTLRVSFDEKPMQTPMVWQYLMLSPGRYQMDIKWQSSAFRSTHGISWQLQCGKGESKFTKLLVVEAGADKEWSSTSVDVDIPEDCGVPQRLALEPQASYEAVVGMRGEVLFDDMVLTRLSDSKQDAKESFR